VGVHINERFLRDQLRRTELEHRLRYTALLLLAFIVIYPVAVSLLFTFRKDIGNPGTALGAVVLALLASAIGYVLSGWIKRMASLVAGQNQSRPTP
jgi:hypothetical protein